MDEKFFPMSKKVSTLKNWMVAYMDNKKAYVLIGVVYGHETEPDGATVMTSEIRTIDFIGNLAETKNRFYKLENPLPPTMRRNS